MRRQVRFSCFLSLLLACPSVAAAHVDKLTGQDYSGFERNDGKGSCCDWHDCRPAFQPFMEQDGEKILDHGDNKFLFDPSKVVRRPSDDGNWHICGSATVLKCIIAPAETRREPGFADTLLGWLEPRSNAEQSRALTDAEILRLIAAAPICSAEP